MAYKLLAIACLMISATNVFGKSKKIDVQQEFVKQNLIRMAQQAQFEAFRSKNDQERAHKAFLALHYTLNASKSLDNEERVRQIRYLLNNSKEIFKNKNTRNGVRDERIRLKKESTKGNTIKSKQFKDLKRMALAIGKLEESSLSLLSQDPWEQVQGTKKFQQALEKLRKVDSPEFKSFCRQVAEARYIELGLEQISNQIQIPDKYLSEIIQLKDTL